MIDVLVIFYKRAWISNLQAAEARVEQKLQNVTAILTHLDIFYAMAPICFEPKLERTI
jgi:hypothetical protein